MIRLLQRTAPDKFAFKVFNDQLPAYAILSHTWGSDDDEVKLQDLSKELATKKPGYAKLKFCGAQAARDGLQYFWIDTCCIDKTNNAELSTTINSMYSWYRNASRCYVYLPDISGVYPAGADMSHHQWMSTWERDFRNHRWFTRGWTLQELIASRSVGFFSEEHTFLGSKESLEQLIHEITKIPVQALRGSLDQYSDDDRMSWTDTRTTTRAEDMAYCMLGILNINMPADYGEGGAGAMARLRRELAVQGRVDEAIRKSKQYSVPFSLKGVPVINKFVDRVGEMGRLEDALLPRRYHGRRKIAVLHGLGGIGKTQLSVEFARGHQHIFSAVFWLDGRTEDTLKQSLASAVSRIPVGQLPETSIKRTLQSAEDIDAAVRDILNWLSIPGNCSWLLIFDNVDMDCNDPNAPPGAYNPSLYYPELDQGSILITTRLPDLEQQGSLIPVGRVSREQAHAIFRAGYGRDYEDSPESSKVFELLAGLPLALAQAAAFMRQSRCSFTTYIGFYEKEWDRLMKGNGSPTPLQAYQNGSVWTTWTVSYNAIRERDPAAANLLSLWSCLDHRDLWFELLTPACRKLAPIKDDTLGWFMAVADSEFSFNATINILLAYSLIEDTQGLSTYAMHPVVHEWAWHLQCNGDKGRSCSLAAVVAGSGVPSDTEKEYWLLQQRLLPHADRALLCRRRLTKQHNSIGVEPFGEPELDALHNLGDLYADQGKLTEAEQMYLRALEVTEKALGADHTSTLQTVNNLGILYSNQGKLAEAEQMCLRALKGYEKALGADHTSTLSTVNNLGNLYKDQGKLAEAEQMYLRALDGKTKALGADHTWTLQTVGNLGILYRNQDKLAKAEQMYLRALEGQTRALGADHTLTLQTVNNLAILYSHQGKLAEAEQMYTRALEGCEKALGADHTSTLDTVNNLAILYSHQGRLAEAEQMYTRALEGKTKALGADHTSTFSTMYNLGLLCELQGRIIDARAMYTKALHGYSAAVGTSHPHSQMIQESLDALDALPAIATFDQVDTSDIPPVDELHLHPQVKRQSKSKRHKLFKRLGMR